MIICNVIKLYFQVLGYRESIKSRNNCRTLPISDEGNFYQLETDLLCWKQEEERLKNMRDAFTLVFFLL